MSKIKKVAWRDGYGYHIDAEIAYNEVERIRTSKGGEVTPLDVLQAAKAKRNPLHREVFDRSVEEAAESYYLDRASRVLRNLTITVIGGPQEPVRAYPVIRRDESDGGQNRVAAVYSSMEDALKDPIYRQTVLAAAIGELVSFRKKYAALSELAILWPSVDELAKAL